METENILKELKKKGCRLTVIRKAVTGIFAENKHPLSVADIAGKLTDKRIGADKTTLYREISFLVKAGMINEIDFGDRRKRYEAATLGHHHHLVCVKCGRIEDIKIKKDLEAEEKRIFKQKRFRILRHALEFFGLCPQCN